MILLLIKKEDLYDDSLLTTKTQLPMKGAFQMFTNSCDLGVTEKAMISGIRK